MAKAAIVLLADTKDTEAMARMANALTATQEFAEAGDDVRLIFDGAAVKWPGELVKPAHEYHDVYEAVRSKVGGVCRYCAGVFGVADQVQATGVAFANQYRGHPSFRQLMTEGYTVLTF